MGKISIQLFKKYQRIYRKEPGSRVFALLADLYRQNGELEKALEICQKGVEEHPHFAIGHLTLALILLDMKKLIPAAESLETAASLSPDSLLIHRLLGQVWIHLRDPIKTLNAYKKVLFLNPKNKKAIRVIKKLEAVTADQYDHAGFDFKDIDEVGESAEKNLSIQPGVKKNAYEPDYSDLNGTDQNEIKQFISRMSIIKALIYRKNMNKAKKFLKGLYNLYSHKETFKKNIQQLDKKFSLSVISKSRLSNKDKKIQTLRRILNKVEKHIENSSAVHSTS